MAATITIGQINLELTEVVEVVVTDIVQDTTVGDYVRDIRIVGSSDALLAQLRIRSAIRENLELAAPEQAF